MREKKRNREKSADKIIQNKKRKTENGKRKRNGSRIFVLAGGSPQPPINRLLYTYISENVLLFRIS